MSKSQYINICFSDKDKELIAWANMIREDNQSVNTWVQAVLLADAVGEPLDVGSVYVPRARGKAASAGIMMFGDDRKSSKTRDKTTSGWQVRGENGEIVAGSIISIRVTRPVMTALLENLHRSHKRIGPYAKAVLRKRIRKLDAGPNIPPDESQIQDIFALYEDRYVTDTDRQVKLERQPSAQDNDTSPCRKEAQREESRNQAQNQEKGQKRSQQDRNQEASQEQDSFQQPSMPTEKNQPHRENQDHQRNRNSHPKTQAPQQQPPQQQKPPQTKREEKPRKNGNPLLSYIK